MQLVDNSDLKVKVQRIIEIDNNSQEKKKVEIDTSCNYYEFLNLVIEAAEKLLIKHGLVGYKSTWYNHDFPIASFIRLKHYLLTQEKFMVNEVNEGYKAYSKSNILAELKFLHELIR